METRKPFSSMDSEKMIGRVFDMIALPYNRSQQIIRQDGLFAFMFTNIGDVIARVNGMVIYPSATPTTALGDSRSISGHWLDLYKGNITLSFDAVTTGTNPLVEIVQLFYTDTTADIIGRNVNK